MASTSCFLQHHVAISSPSSGRNPTQRYQAVSVKPNQLVCKAQKQDDESAVNLNSSVSRRLALTVLIGAAAVGSKVSPADAAYGEAGMYFPFYFIFTDPIEYTTLFILSTSFPIARFSINRPDT